MRARLALAVSGQTCELREVVLSCKPEALRQVSAKATVPVLVDTDGHVLDESLDIMLWALQRHDPLQWLPAQGEMADALFLIGRCDGEFKPQLDRYKYPGRFNLADRDEARDMGAWFIGELEQRLSRDRCLSGTQWGLVDAAVAPFVRQFAHTDIAWFASRPGPLQNLAGQFRGLATVSACHDQVPAVAIRARSDADLHRAGALTSRAMRFATCPLSAARTPP